MSQCYRIRLREAIRDTVRAADRTTHRIELTDLLPQDAMRGLLRRALERRGFREDDDGLLRRRDADGVVISADLGALEVSTEVDAAEDVSLVVDAAGTGESRGAARADAREQLEAERRRARQGIADREQALQRRVTQVLEDGEPARLRELNQALQEVYADALKRKAAELGEVLSVEEGTDAQGRYELTITVAQ